MEKQLIPQLRFSEFEENWFLKKLSDIGKIITGSTPSTFVSEYYENGIIHFVSPADIQSNRFIINTKTTLTELGFSKTRHIKENSVLFVCIGSTIGKVAQASQKCATNQQINAIECNSNNLDSFLYSLLELKGDRIKLLAGNQAVPQINKTDFSKFRFYFPKLSEQQKIASFLTDVDDKITKLTKKKELLEQYKKGIMQKIFNQELRFKDDEGNAFPVWEEKMLGEITKYYDGTHQTPNYVSEGVPFYSVEHVTANQFEKTKYISREVFEKENKRVRLEKGDILMTRIGNVGKARYIDWDVKASFYVSLALIKQNPSFSSKYLAQYINSVLFQRELWKRIIHVAFPIKINLGEIGKCLVQLPCLEEQTKIANFLSDIDLKIEALNTKIVNSKAFKKGLLQKMFV